MSNKEDDIRDMLREERCTWVCKRGWWMVEGGG